MLPMGQMGGSVHQPCLGCLSSSCVKFTGDSISMPTEGMINQSW